MLVFNLTIALAIILVPKRFESLAFYHAILWILVLLYVALFNYDLKSLTLLLLTYYFLTVLFVRLLLSNLIKKEKPPNVNFISESTRTLYLRRFLLLMFVPYVFHELNKYGLDMSLLVSDPTYAFILMRQESVLAAGYGEKFSIWNNLVILSNFSFLFHIYYYKRITRAVLLSAILNIFYTSFLGSKMGIVVTLLIIIYVLLSSKDYTKVLFLSSLTLFIFAASVVLVNMGSDYDARELFIILKSYLIGGPLSFDRIVSENVYLGNSQVLWRPFLELGRSIGIDVDVDSRHLFYVEVDGFTTNVYSWFISFFKNVPLVFSLIIIFSYVFFLELISVFRYKYKLLDFLFPSLVVGAIFSIHAEQIISGLVMYIKLVIMFIMFVNGKSFSSHWREECA